MQSHLLKFLIAIAWLGSMSVSAALNPPELMCASVLPNGDVELTWIPTSDPTGIFVEYQIWHSASAAGPFNQVGTVNGLLISNFLHIGANGNTAEQHYYVNVLDNGPAPNISTDSDTLTTLFLTVGQSVPLGSAVLNWNTQHIPPVPSSSQLYVIEMEYPQGIWTVLDTNAYTNLNFSHVISICNDSLSFRVGLASSFGCVSYSNVTGDVFEDDTPPSIPQVITASVDTATGNATFKWLPSPEPDTDGYIIVNVIQTGNVIIDTVIGQFNNSYTHLAGDPNQSSLTYTVAAFDTCLSGMPAQPNTSATQPGQSTIHLSGVYEQCTPSIFLQFNPYLGWDTIVPTYELFVEVNNGPAFLLANVSPNDLSYYDLSIIPFQDYCYFIKATGVDSCQVSFSNRYCVTTDYPGLPQLNYIRTATVMANDHIRVVDRVDQGASVSGYRLERAENDGSFSAIATAPPSSGPDVIFNDFDVQADLFSYQYRVVALDSCGNDALTSNMAATMWLRAESTLDGFNHLSWNGYQTWDGFVGGYRIFRSIDGGMFNLAGLVPQGQWYFNDDVNMYTSGTGRFCYYIEAVENGNSIAVDTLSRSNLACATQEDLVFIPNAFIAGGSNPEFFPVFSFADVRVFEFLIMNRWGQIIWQAEDINDRWDGKVNGEFVPQGVYVYSFAYARGDGKREERIGHVTFINSFE